MIGIEKILVLSAFLFCVGVYLMLTKRNAIIMLVGIELILNAANLNFIGFNQFDPGQQGVVFAVFLIVIAVAEVSVALAILIKVYSYYKTSDLDELDLLKEQ